jgi:methyltransferase (TIGR00027 family)
MRAGRASSTARLIAAATVVARHDSALRDVVPADAAGWSDRFLSASGGWLGASVRHTPGRAAWRLFERALAPGIIRHWVLRKRRIESLSRAAAAEGFSQLVVLGAGLDSLAFRLAAEHVIARAIEVDHPATQAIIRAGAGPHTRVALVPADLSAPGSLDALSGHPSFDRARPTLLIAEGLLMYLAEPQVRALLRAAAALPCPRARLIASYMDSPPGQLVGFHTQSRLIHAWLRRRGEPMRWSITDGPAAAFLAECGWRRRELIRAADLVAELDPASRPLAGENLLVADRA